MIIFQYRTHGIWKVDAISNVEKYRGMVLLLVGKTTSHLSITAGLDERGDTCANPQRQEGHISLYRGNRIRSDPLTLIEESDMAEKNKPKPKAPDLKDVEAGSDADATPIPEVGKTPPDPNKDK
ncbi:MAG TPA: hypothetical protein VIL88_16570 [Devosia sp.]|uniref:hypothetical protein n=1 Tax=Devosia sp. TaxID=1871048 RepID=UPI002F9271C1